MSQEPWSGKRDEDVLWSNKSLEDRIETSICHLEGLISEATPNSVSYESCSLALTILNSLKYIK